MADNLTTVTDVSTIPEGTVIATDDAGAGGHVQLVKLAISTNGSATALTADNTDGLLVNLGTNNDVVISDGGNTITVDGTVAVTNAGLTELAAAIDTEVQVDVVGALPAGNNNIGDVDVASIAAGDNNIGNVDIVTMPNVTLAAGTNTNEVVGDAAHDAVVAGNPVLIGGYASAAAPSDVSGDGDVARIWTTVKGAVNVADAGGTLSVDDGGGNISIDDGGNSITVDGTVTANLAAGTNNIGDVDVLSIVPGTGATNLGKAEDAAHTSGDVGIMALGVRQSNQADFGADGDYVPFSVDDDGGLRVSIVGDSTTDGDAYTVGATDGVAIIGAYEASPNTLANGDMGVLSLTSDRKLRTSAEAVVPGTGATNLGKAEDAAHSSGDVGVMSLGVRQSTQADFGADGDYVPFSVDDDGGLRVSVIAGGGTGGTAAADDADFTDGTTPGTPAMGVYESTPSTVTDGDLGVVGITETRSLKVHVSGFTAGDVNLGNVDVASSALPSGASTLAEQQTQTTHLATIAGDTTDIEAAVELIDDTIFADDAAYTAATSKLMVVGGQYQSSPNTLDDNDAGSILLDANHAVQAVLRAGTAAIGKLAANSGVDIGDVDITSIAAGDNNIGNVDIVSLPALAAGTNEIGSLLPPDTDVTAHTNYAKKYYTSAGAVTDGIVWSPAGGKRWHVVSMFINTSAAATVTFEDDKAGGDEAVMKMELAANSGMTINYGEQYPLASGEDAADLLVTTSAGNIYITVTGYEI